VVYSSYLRRLKQTANAAEAELREGLTSEDILLTDRMAQFVGIQSAGATQVRGNGALALTRRDLRFRMWVPNRRYDVSLDRITAVGTTRSHLGKAVGADLLKVSFTNDQGAEDAIVWRVAKGPHAWITAIEEGRA